MSGLLLRDLSRQDRYKLLCAVVVPRPIALVTTLDLNGAVNAAPFSFFNVFSEDLPLIVLGLQHKPDRTPKDTTRNIQRDGEFAVQMVDDALATAASSRRARAGRCSIIRKPTIPRAPVDAVPHIRSAGTPRLIEGQLI